MNILIENAGAEKGFLLLEKANQWFIEAEGTMENRDVKVLESVPIEPNPQRDGIATTLINYVARTTDAVVLDDAVNDGHFTRDPYIVARQPKSVLCVPLVNQGKLAGIVYLENNLVTGAFTPKRLETVQLLGAQAAISLDNARLYEEFT